MVRWSLIAVCSKSTVGIHSFFSLNLFVRDPLDEECRSAVLGLCCHTVGFLYSVVAFAIAPTYALIAAGRDVS